MGRIRIAATSTSDLFSKFFLYQRPTYGTGLIREYSELGRLPEVKEQIIEMSINGSGVRDIARVLKISPTTVIEELKKKNQQCTM